MWMRRLAISALVLGGIACAGGLLYAWKPSIEPIASPAAATFAPKLVRKGAELALIGDCQACHTAPGGRPYAGGLAMETPFGTIYSTNITPDGETGIGTWSLAAFKRALREGVSRNGQHLYPAFPYDHFTRTSDDDVEALYAYFMSREPVEAKAKPNDLPFPINIRLMLAGWKLLFFREERFAPDPFQDDAWNRGKYLVEGLGHCGACHSPRSFMGAEETSRPFEGGEAEGWRAYALGAASQAPVLWDEASLTQYLAEGFAPQHGVALSSMAVVTGNLSRVSRQEVAAMARYLASLSKRDDTARAGAASLTSAKAWAPGLTPQSAGSQANVPAALETGSDVGSGPGGRIYLAACASCHDSGRPPPLGGVRLAWSTAVAGESPKNLVNIVLDGIAAADGIAGPVMPGFADVLSDQQLGDLVRYLRVDVAHKAGWSGLDEAIGAARSARQRQPKAQK